MEAAIWGNGGSSTEMRRSIRIGEKNGIKERTTDKELSGLRITKDISKIGMTKNMVTGMTSCCASFSLLTIEPIPAYIVP